MPKLSDKEIKQRLIEGRNYKRLYFELKVKYDEQAKEIRQLKAENDALKQQLTDTTETLSAQIAELQTMVFGRKQKPRSGSHSNRPPTQPRDKDSYRRPKPDESEVTSIEHLPIHACNHCGGKLIDKEEHIRYVEDIVLAALNALDQFKTVEKQTIERGYCVPCGKWSSAKDLRGQAVTIGPHVRTLICYLITLRDHSYDQVIHILWDLYQFKITEGEITTILDARRLELLPEYEKLKEKIRAGPAVHMDESRWKIQAEHAGYAWSMSNPGSPDVVFKLADNRGGGNARDLLGENYQGIGITDRYKAYKHLFEVTREDGSIVSNHQICWAHLQRTAKDLTHLVCLSKAKQRHVTRFYTRLASIYAAIRQYQAEPFAASKREGQQAILLKQTIQLCKPSKQDPKKLADLKAGILEY